MGGDPRQNGQFEVRLRKTIPVGLVILSAVAAQLSTSCMLDRAATSTPRHVPTQVSAENTTDRATDGTDARVLGLLTYNAYLRPGIVGWGDDNRCRAGAVGKRLVGLADEVDVVALNETFDRHALGELVDEAEGAYPYRVTRYPKGNFLNAGGGLSLLSKHPILKTRAHQFGSCSTLGDCLATKGFLHAVVEVSRALRINVIATHLDAGQSDDGVAARRRQLDKIRDYLRKHRVGESWPTVLLGDLNVDGLPSSPDWFGSKRELPDEYRWMMAKLSRDCSGCATGRCAQRCRGRPLDLVREDETFWSPRAQRKGSLATLTCGMGTGRACRKGRFEDPRNRVRIDYALQLRLHRPNEARAELVSAEHLDFESDSCRSRYLSDHKAVRARLELQPKRLRRASR